MTKQGQKVCWGVGGACCFLVVWLSAVSPSAASMIPPDPAQQRALFDGMVTPEDSERQKTLDDWAHHPWSQQDAFGAIEKDRAYEVGRQQQVRPQIVFRALDDGMRAGWTMPDGGTVRATITPLRQRPLD